MLAAIALLSLAQPKSLHAQARSAFAAGLGSANDGSTFMTLNGSGVLNTTDRGWYSDAGIRNSNANYFTGVNDAAAERRGFFLFDLSTYQTPIVSARISLFNCATGAGLPCNGLGNGFSSPNSSETVDLFDFFGSRTALVGGTGGLGAFTDLGSGAVFGTRSISAADNGTTVTFNLNSAGIASLNGARGNTFAVGSAMRLGTTSVVPEPGTSVLVGIDLVFVGALVRRRHV
jgi:hypothetical protein